MQMRVELRWAVLPVVLNGTFEPRTKQARAKQALPGEGREGAARISPKVQSQGPRQATREALQQRLFAGLRRRREAKSGERLAGAQRGSENSGSGLFAGRYQIGSVIALDLGTKTGFAVWRGGQLALGTWPLTKASERKGKAPQLRRFDPRVKVLYATLEQTIAVLPKPALVIFEDVEFSTYTKQTQLWASLRAAMWLAPGADLYDCVPVGTLKKFATGHGGADKVMMEAAFKREPVSTMFSELDDNAIDAYFLLKWALEKYGLEKT